MPTTTPPPAATTSGDTATVEALLLAAGLTDAQTREAIAQAEITHEAAQARPRDEMNARFRERSQKKGLRGKALGVWLLTGDSGARTAAAKRREAAKSAAAAKRSEARAGGTPRAPREGSALHAAVTILKDARQPLAVQEIYDRAVKRGLAGGLKGKTPVATLGAQLATANKKGIHVERPKPGHYTLRAAGK